MTEVDAPLTGVRVIEAGTYMSAPFASLALAHLGAEVIKVESPAGDPFRKFSLRHDGVSAAWVSTNHGKQSVVLDLKDPADAGELADLLGGADVFIQNWRPGVAEALDLSPLSLSERYPRLVHLAISGYGETGPRSDVPVFDGVLQAASGFAAQEARRGQPPSMTRSFVVDKTVAGFAVQAVLAALVQRERTGRGARLSLSMLDVMAYFNFPDLCQDRTFLPPAPHVDLESGRSAILRTADGHILASPVSGKQVAGAIEAIGHPEWKDELKAITSPVAFLDELLNRLESVTVDLTTAECERRFAAHDVPATAVLSVDEHLSDPQTLHNEIYLEASCDGLPIRRVRYPLRIDGRRLPDTPAASRRLPA